jgi:hypothetical protein
LTPAIPYANSFGHVTLPRFHVHQNVGNFLMNGGRNGKEGGGSESVVIEELAAEGVLFDPLAEEVGKDLDPFDLNRSAT